VPDIITDDLAHRTLTSNALLAIPSLAQRLQSITRTVQSPALPF
jgi:hypothetical protein